jgi:hypothetical protein
MTPRISTPAQEGSFQAAKWLKVQALLDAEELESLLALGEPSFLFPLAGLFTLESMNLSKESFCVLYSSWIEGLKKVILPLEEELRKGSAIAWTRSTDSVWLQEVPGNRYLVKPCEPVVQIQVHQMGYSTVDGEFRPMILSRDSIFWGLQISFPQVYQHPKTMELLEVEEGLNVELYQLIRRWVRDNTVATPMLVEGKRKNIPIRIGKRCFSWVNTHPQLLAQKLSVLELAHGII